VYRVWFACVFVAGCVFGLAVSVTYGVSGSAVVGTAVSVFKVWFPCFSRGVGVWWWLLLGLLLVF